MVNITITKRIADGAIFYGSLDMNFASEGNYLSSRYLNSAVIVYSLIYRAVLFIEQRVMDSFSVMDIQIERAKSNDLK